MSLFHPDVAIALSHSSLGVQEGHEDTPLSTQPGIITVTLFQSIFIILFSKPVVQQTTQNKTDKITLNVQTLVWDIYSPHAGRNRIL